MRIVLRRHLLPMKQVERNLNKSGIGNILFLVYLPDLESEFWRRAKSPQWNKMSGILWNNDGSIVVEECA